MKKEESFRVVTYDRKEILKRLDSLEYLRENFMLKDSSNKKSLNYTSGRLNFSHQKAISLVFAENNDFVAFSSLAYLPIWGNGSRCLSRMYIRPEYKTQSFRTIPDALKTRVLRKFTAEMVKQQINKCETDFIFFSREHPGLRVLKRITRELNEACGIKKDFFVPDDMYLVCNAPENKSCWQYISLCQLSEGEGPINLPYVLRRKVTKSQWSLLDDPAR